MAFEKTKAGFNKLRSKPGIAIISATGASALILYGISSGGSNNSFGDALRTQAAAIAAGNGPDNGNIFNPVALPKGSTAHDVEGVISQAVTASGVGTDSDPAGILRRQVISAEAACDDMADSGGDLDVKGQKLLGKAMNDGQPNYEQSAKAVDAYNLCSSWLIRRVESDYAIMATGTLPVNTVPLPTPSPSATHVAAALPHG